MLLTSFAPDWAGAIIRGCYVVTYLRKTDAASLMLRECGRINKDRKMSQDTLVQDDDGAVDPNLPQDPSRRFWVTTACAVGGVAGVAPAVPLVGWADRRGGKE